MTRRFKRTPFGVEGCRGGGMDVVFFLLPCQSWAMTQATKGFANEPFG
jgi:hypothetical protein